jgi:hypothetical protein
MHSINRPYDLMNTSLNGNTGSTVNLAVLTTVATVVVSPVVGAHRACRILNSGTNTVFINLGGAAVSASLTNSFPMLPNTERVFWFHNDWTTVAAISTATGNTIYITMGEGAI